MLENPERKEELSCFKENNQTSFNTLVNENVINIYLK